MNDIILKDDKLLVNYIIFDKLIQFNVIDKLLSKDSIAAESMIIFISNDCECFEWFTKYKKCLDLDPDDEDIQGWLFTAPQIPISGYVKLPWAYTEIGKEKAIGLWGKDRKKKTKAKKIKLKIF